MFHHAVKYSDLSDWELYLFTKKGGQSFFSKKGQFLLCFEEGVLRHTSPPQSLDLHVPPCLYENLIRILLQIIIK